MATLQLSSLITILYLTFRIGTINSAVTTGYFYDNPIRPFNPTSFSSLRPTGQYSSIPFGQKVETNTQTRLKLPPIPSLPPLSTYIPKQRVQNSTPIPYNNGRTVQQQQNTQYQRPPQQQQQQNGQYQQTSPSYSYPKAQIPFSTTQITNFQESSYTQQRNNIPQSTNRPITQFYQSTTPAFNTQRQTPNPTLLTVVPQQQQVVVPTSVVAIPTASPVINAISNPTQTRPSAGLLASPDIYVVDGRQLKQYKVYEHIDNDIDQEVHNFLPADFFLNTYHSMIGDTHPLGEDVQVQNRASSFQQRSQQITQPTPNTIALGSGGLGFVKLPNGSVYLGSGSLGYISSLQHSQDVQDLRSRTSSSGPDALHFGHGSLRDSFYYGGQKD